MPITTAASQSSATLLPVNSAIYDAKLDVTTAYSAGTQISLGTTGTTNLFMGVGDNTATVAGLYQVMQDTPMGGGSPLALLVTVQGGPAAGAGFAVVLYSIPNS
jgi:hypothetical protein